MIAFLEGTVAGTTGASVFVNVGGVGFDVGMSQRALASLPAAGERVLVYTYLQVRDDGMSLYGFLSADEKALFERLITVTGVGPKVALAALSAYHVVREPVTGEAHTSTAVGSVIDVADDGVTGVWQYVNSDISGNPVTLSLELDGEVLYVSDTLKPGETLEGLTLRRPLEPGEYKALAVTTIYGPDNEPLFTNRVPVTLKVGS